ncbi:hypothetical protein [Streptomyces sp. NPDC058751]|uniref:hypothetical protein n=1 Tax=Streptomyces sp. NPDC058751 TaxID=3346623 RepID=UPI00367E8B32
MSRYETGEVMHGDAIGEVIASADPSLGAGDLVVHRLGRREYAVARAGAFRRVDKDACPTPSVRLGFDAAFDHHDGPVLDRLRDTLVHRMPWPAARGDSAGKRAA